MKSILTTKEKKNPTRQQKMIMKNQDLRRTGKKKIRQNQQYKYYNLHFQKKQKYKEKIHPNKSTMVQGGREERKKKGGNTSLLCFEILTATPQNAPAHKQTSGSDLVESLGHVR